MISDSVPSEPPQRASSAAIEVYLTALGVCSRRTVQQSLDTVARLASGNEKTDAQRFRWAGLDRKAIGMIRQQLAEQYAPATANKMLSCLRSLLRVCRDQGLLSFVECQAATAVPNVAPVYHPARPQTLNATEIQGLFAACLSEASPAGKRDAALLAILLSCGLRRAEAIALQLDDYSHRAGRLRIHSSAGGGKRAVTLSENARRLVRGWLEHRGSEPGPLLMPVNKGRAIQHRRLTDQAIYDIVRRLAIRAQLPHVTTRSLRRTYVVSLIARGLPLEQVRELVGHASWVTTAAYSELAHELKAGGFQPFEIPANAPTQPADHKKGEQP